MVRLRTILLAALVLSALAPSLAQGPAPPQLWKRQGGVLSPRRAGDSVAIDTTLLKNIPKLGLPHPTVIGPVQHPAVPLTTPTYDGSGQATHPDVLYIPGGWNGYEYWMAMTPYPNGDTTKENPSILASHDGTTWVVPDGLVNPISPDPADGTYNSDTDLVLGPDSKLYVFYRQTTAANTFWVRSSADGVTWSAATATFTGTQAGVNAIGSPAVLYDADSATWIMWYVDLTNKRLYRVISTAAEGPWSAPALCDVVDLPAARTLWHFNVTVKNGLYYGFFFNNNSGVQNTGTLSLGVSRDGLRWSITADPILSAGEAGRFDEAQIYRGSAVATTTGFDLWYGGVDTTGVRRIGRTAIAVGAEAWSDYVDAPPAPHAQTHAGADEFVPSFLRFGGRTVDFPALTFNGATLYVRKADRSGPASLNASTITVQPSSGNAYIWMVSGSTTWRIVNNGTDWALYDGSSYVLTVKKTTGQIVIPGLKATTGTRFLCIDTSGAITSSATACSGT